MWAVQGWCGSPTVSEGSCFFSLLISLPWWVALICIVQHGCPPPFGHFNLQEGKKSEGRHTFLRDCMSSVSFLSHWLKLRLRPPLAARDAGKYRHTSFCCTLLYCASQILNFLRIEDCGNPVMSFFPVTFSHFMSLCQILVILTFQTFRLLLYSLWWSEISELCCYYCDSLKAKIMVSIF